VTGNRLSAPKPPAATFIFPAKESQNQFQQQVESAEKVKIYISWDVSMELLD
jgi:hypothetical protein